MPTQGSTAIFTPHDEALAHVIEAGYRPASPLTQSLLEARQTQHRYLSFLAQDPPKTQAVQEVTVAGPQGLIRVGVLYPLQPSGKTPIVYLRGGGWWVGSLATQSAAGRSHFQGTRLWRIQRLTAIRFGRAAWNCTVDHLQIEYRGSSGLGLCRVTAPLRIPWHGTVTKFIGCGARLLPQRKEEVGVARQEKGNPVGPVTRSQFNDRSCSIFKETI